MSVARVFVAQISNLLYRRIPFGWALNGPGAHDVPDASAGWKPAIQRIGNLRYVEETCAA